jgi:hypothetical protein
VRIRDRRNLEKVCKKSDGWLATEPSKLATGYLTPIRAKRLADVHMTQVERSDLHPAQLTVPVA